MIEKEILNIAGNEVVLDPKNLEFNETTLSNYIQKEGGYYDNFGAYLALAEKVQQLREVEYETIYNERLVEAKDQGATDKISEAKAKCDSTVVEAKNLVVEAKYRVKRLIQHLKAWDKNHDNAQSMGYMLRKEIDKLNFEIKGYGDNYKSYLQEKVLENTITPIDEQNGDGFGDLDLGDLKSLVRK